jgi:type IV pilus assembly protein PilM
MSKGDILCIDWDERSLRILETAVQRSGPSVRRAVNVAIPQGLDVRDPSLMGDFLRRTLGEHRIRSRRAIVDVPRQDTVLNRLTLPTGTMDELAAMVHMQIAKELPFSKDQAVIDFAIVPKPGSATCDVWVAAIRVNVLEYYRQVFANTGLILERMGLRPYANLRALQASGMTQGRIVMVDVGPAMTEINILRDGELMYTRAASVAVPVTAASSADGDGDAEARQPLTDVGTSWPMDNLLIEVNRTITAYRATDLGAAIDRIILSGTAGINQRLMRAFEERFSVATEVFSIPPAIRWPRDLAGSAAPFSAVIGLALSNMGDAAQRFDFVHVKEPEAEHRQRVRQRPWMVATVAMFGVAAAVFAYQPIRARSNEIEGIKADIALVNADQKQREAALKKIADLNDWEAKNVTWIDYIQKIAAVFPSNKQCYITKLEVNTDKAVISLDLAAEDRFVAAKVVESIRGVLDAKGRPIFQAVGGNKADADPKNAEYPIEDHVTITVTALAPKPKTKR